MAFYFWSQSLYNRQEGATEGNLLEIPITGAKQFPSEKAGRNLGCHNLQLAPGNQSPHLEEQEPRFDSTWFRNRNVES